MGLFDKLFAKKETEQTTAPDTASAVDAASKAADAAEDAAKKAAETVADAADAASDKASDLVQAVQETVSDIEDAAGKAASDMTDAAKEAISQAQETAGDTLSAVKEAVNDTASDLSDAVEKAAGTDIPIMEADTSFAGPDTGDASAAAASAPASGVMTAEEEQNAFEVTPPDEKALARLRRVTLSKMPYNIMSLEGQKKLFADICNVFPALAMLDMQGNMWSQSEKSGKVELQEVGQLAFRVDKYLAAMKPEPNLESIETCQQEEAQKIFQGFDMWAHMLKPEFSATLIKYSHAAANRLLTEIDLDAEEKVLVEAARKAMEPYQNLLKEVNELEKKPEAEVKETLIAKRKELGEMVMQFPQIFVAYDGDFNKNLPYLSTNGRVQIFSNPILAESARKYFSEQHEGEFTVRAVPQSAIKPFFQQLQHDGILVALLDNGTHPANLWLKEICPLEEQNMIENLNSGIRGCFIRELQLAFRLKKNAEALKGTPQERLMQQFMLTMRANALREMGRGLLYVLSSAPAKEGVTLYTPKAMELAKQLAESRKLPESALIAPGDTSCEVYEGSIQLRVTTPKDKPGIENAFVCVFTDHKGVDTVRAHFAKNNLNDSIIVATWDEIAAQAQQCKGALIDMLTFGRQVQKIEFPDVEKMRASKGPIVVSFQDENQAKKAAEGQADAAAPAAQETAAQAPADAADNSQE